MPRARNIKPGFFKNEELVELPALTRILFIGLWCMADREGRLEDRPKKIKMEVLPADDCNVNAALDALQERGFITRYAVDGGRYIAITNFAKHQNPHHKEVASVIPPPKTQGEPGASPRQTPGKPGADPADSSYLDSSYSDSLIPDPSEENDEDPPPPVMRARAGGSAGDPGDDPPEPIPLELDPAFAEVVGQFTANIHPPTPHEQDMIRDWCASVERGVVLYAINEAAAAGVRTAKYVDGIILRKQQAGITTVAALDAHERDWADRKAKSGASTPGTPRGQPTSKASQFAALAAEIEQREGLTNDTG